MENIPLELLVNYPTFECIKEGDTLIYVGTLIVNADTYKIRVKQTTGCEGIQFELIDEFGLLKNYKKPLEDLKLMKISDVTTFVENVEKIIKTNSSFPINHCLVYRKILNEYMEFSKFFIDIESCSLSPDLSSIKVSSRDEKRREHAVEFGIDYECKDLFYFKEYDVPTNIIRTLDKKSSSLLDLYNIFLGYIEGLQTYFDLMDVIDMYCKVIDPKERLRKYNFRRVWLGENVSVIITINPFNVNACPHFAFLGPDRGVNQFRDKLNGNLEKWDNDGDVFQKILNTLGLEEFPGNQCPISQSQNIQLLKDDSDCSICFCSSLNSKLPEIVCNNKCCENFYHKDCLYEWLLSINSKKMFNEIQGPCPNCEKMISCPIPD